MITITEPASLKIKELLSQEENQDMYLRVGVKSGGCSGFSYGMGFDEDKLDNDNEFDQHGVKVIIDEESMKHISGVEIDYKESMMGGGFTINNPNAVATCGCGSSFKTASAEGTPEKC